MERCASARPKVNTNCSNCIDDVWMAFFSKFLFGYGGRSDGIYLCLCGMCRRTNHQKYLRIHVRYPAPCELLFVWLREKIVESAHGRYARSCGERVDSISRHRKTKVKILMHLKWKIYFSILMVVNFKINMVMLSVGEHTEPPDSSLHAEYTYVASQSQIHRRLAMFVCCLHTYASAVNKIHFFLERGAGACPGPLHNFIG